MNSVKGTIIRRTIRGKVRFYHQWREDGRTRSRYLKPDEVEPLRAQLTAAKAPPSSKAMSEPEYQTPALIGRRLEEFAYGVRKLTPRTALEHVLEYLRDETKDRPLLIAGGPSTGKTVLLRHLLSRLSSVELERTAYLHLTSIDTPERVGAALSRLRETGMRYVLLDGLTEPAAISGNGLKIVAAGRFVLDSADIDLSGISFWEYTTLKGQISPTKYLEVNGRLDGFFAPDDLRGKTAALNDRFLLETCDWAVRRLRENRRRREAFVANDISKLIARFATSLGQENPDFDENEHQLLLSVPTALRLAHAHGRLRALLEAAELQHLGAAELKIVRDLIEYEIRLRLLEDEVWSELLATRASTSVSVRRLLYAPGHLAFVIAEEDEITCELLTVADSEIREDRQLRYLNDPALLDAIGHRYGIVTARSVLYNGRDARHSSGVSYRNLEKFLSRSP